MVLVGLASYGASAAQVEKKDSWVLNEITADGTTVCEASTEDRGVIRHYTLKVQKVKNSNMPVEVFLHEKGKAEHGPLAVATIGSELLIFNQSDIGDKNQTLWYLPDETKMLVDALKSNAKTFEVKAHNSKGRTLKFKLKGAAHILSSMEKRCNYGKALVDERLSALTNHPATFDQNPAVFDGQSLSQIRALYYEIADHHAALLGEESKLQKLEQANAPNLKERDALRVEKSDLSIKVIPGLKQDIQSTQSRIAIGEKRLVQLKTEIPAAEKQRASRQAIYDDASKKIAPHVPKHNELARALRSAEQNLSNALSEISSSENEISSNNRKIQELDREAQDLSYTIQRLRSDLSSAQSEADRRYREYQNFNATAEIRRRLNGSSQYLSLQSDVARLEREVSREQDSLRSIERDLQRAESQLNHCKSNPDNNCDSLASQVRDLSSNVSSKRSDVRRLESQLSSAESDMNRIKNSIESDVRREEDRLRRAYDEAASKLNSIQSQMERAEGERRDIMEYQIPRLQSRNIDLRNLISSLESQLGHLRQEVKRTQAELDRFDQSVGYAKLEQTLESARSHLENANNLLSKLTSEDAQLKNQLPQEKTRLVKLSEELKVKEARLVQATQRLAQLDKELASFDSSKASLESTMAAIKSKIQDTQSRYMRFFQ